MANEKWVVPTYEGTEYNNYLISNKGRIVTRIKKGKNAYKKPIFGEYRLVELSVNAKGYLRYFPTSDSGKRRYLAVHRLVFESFISPIEEGMQIDHKDANKLNNSVSNLQMMTCKENVVKYHTIDKLKKRK
jgi:hypothetical protein